MINQTRRVDMKTIGISSVIKYLNRRIKPSISNDLHQIEFYSYTTGMGETYYGCFLPDAGDLYSNERIDIVENQLNDLLENTCLSLANPDPLQGVYAVYGPFIYLRKDSYQLIEKELNTHEQEGDGSLITPSRKVEMQTFNLTGNHIKFMKTEERTTSNVLRFAQFKPYIIQTKKGIQTKETYYICNLSDDNEMIANARLKEIEMQLNELLLIKRTLLVNPDKLFGVYIVIDKPKDKRIIMDKNSFDLIKDEVNMKEFEDVSGEVIGVDIDYPALETLFSGPALDTLFSYPKNPPPLVPKDAPPPPPLGKIPFTGSREPEALLKTTKSPSLGLPQHVWNRIKKLLVPVDYDKHTSFSTIQFYSFNYLKDKHYYTCCLYEYNSKNTFSKFMKEQNQNYVEEGDYFLIDEGTFNKIKQNLAKNPISLESLRTQQFFSPESITTNSQPDESTNKKRKRN